MCEVIIAFADGDDDFTDDVCCVFAKRILICSK